MATFGEIELVLEQLVAAYPNHRLTATAVKLYAGALGEVPAEGLGKAAQEIILSDEWFPSVSKLQRRAVAHSDGPLLRETRQKAMAERLRVSWRCCAACYMHPCKCRLLGTERIAGELGAGDEGTTDNL